MVQLSPPRSLDVTEEPEGQQEQRVENLEVSTTYQGYETYIEDGLICLKHKVRNLEKKKLKLKEYQKRLVQGEVLNKDQMAAVEKFDQVLHHLEFAREMHRTLDGLTQSLLKAQKKAVKQEQAEKLEAERRRLTLMLQFQNLLVVLQQEHVRKELMAGSSDAPYIPAPLLHSLNQLAALLGVTRDGQLSLEEQMEQAASAYMDLLDGKEKPVVGSTYKRLKEELLRLLNYKFFSRPPPPPSRTPVRSVSSAGQSALKFMPQEKSKEFLNRLYQTDVETADGKDWKEDFKAVREREPPDSWDADFPDGAMSPQTPANKPWKGAATFIPKVPSKACSAESKRPNQMNILVEVFSSPSALPEDPVLRKQHLEDLMTKIHGSFSFMQDSLLDGETSLTNGTPRLTRRSPGALSPLAQGCLRSPPDFLAKTLHSTPLPPRLRERKASMTSGDQSLETSDLEPSVKHQSQESLQLTERKRHSSPPLYHREALVSGQEEKNCSHTPGSDSGKQSPCNGLRSNTSTPPQAESFSTPPMRRALTTSQFQNIHSVFKMAASLPHNGELHYKSHGAVCSGPKYSTASTQTPPEFAPPDDELLMGYQSDYSAINGGQIFPSPGFSAPSYTRGSVRGMAPGGKGAPHTCWSSGRQGGPYAPPPHLRDSGPLLYAAKDSGYQHMFRRGGGRHGCNAAWSDSSPVSSPDRDGAFTMVDSGHGDSLSVSTVEVPLTPHSHPPAALLPMPLYPLSQPLRVAFTASRTANFAPGNLDQPIVFDQLHSNLGEMYDAHIGRFTCPVNGTYVFIFHILKLAINVPLYVNLMRNEEVMVSAYANDGAPDHETASNHAILPLFQGDQVWLRLHRGAIYGSTWKYSTFSGFLLYQE
ncbi:PREDICTED: caprin-2-like [Cyprinodon variegatus]|nr:PREDICTED: caprin-2-like [Cyprinodon variegatus]